MRKKRMPLSESELMLYDVQMIIWKLKKKYFKDIVGDIEKPKKFKVWDVPSKKDVDRMCKELAKEYGVEEALQRVTT